VDTGFMRHRESAEVMEHLRRMGFRNLHLTDASPLFFRRLRGVVDPEEKRAVVGRAFVDVLHEELARLMPGEDWLLVQGTIYPDSIESGGTQDAACIKTHHNRVEEIDALLRAGKVVEPLVDFYKDEVRALGRSLDLPTHLLDRHPFPGPGLAIRILCRQADRPREEPVMGSGEPAAAFCAEHGLGMATLPVRSVGVQGDLRTYERPALLWQLSGGNVDWPRLLDCATGLANRFPGINRALLARRSPAGLGLHTRPTLLDEKTVAGLRRVDDLVRRRLEHIKEIWQIPVVSLPLYDAEGRQVFVVRPVCSRDAMTAQVYQMPQELLESLYDDVAKVEGTGLLLYDLTSKPPGTIEWE